jgi:hypothetical protein
LEKSWKTGQRSRFVPRTGTDDPARGGPATLPAQAFGPGSSHQLGPKAQRSRLVGWTGTKGPNYKRAALLPPHFPQIAKENHARLRPRPQRKIRAAAAIDRAAVSLPAVARAAPPRRPRPRPLPLRLGHSRAPAPTPTPSSYARARAVVAVACCTRGARAAGCCRYALPLPLSPLFYLMQNWSCGAQKNVILFLLGVKCKIKTFVQLYQRLIQNFIYLGFSKYCSVGFSKC